jgi:hypothetical protein
MGRGWACPSGLRHIRVTLPHWIDGAGWSWVVCHLPGVAGGITVNGKGNLPIAHPPLSLVFYCRISFRTHFGPHHPGDRGGAAAEMVSQCLGVFPLAKSPHQLLLFAVDEPGCCH